MFKKLDYILLVDDDEATNLFNQIIIEEADCTRHIKITQGGREALDFLQTKVNDGFPCPELIFLDLNMPGMDGWGFLKEYENLDPKYKGHIIVVLLTTSLNPADRKKADSLAHFVNFQNKPLTQEKIDRILEQYFEQA